MIRNTRSDTGLTWTKRHVETVPITFSPTEQALYDDIAALKNGTEKPLRPCKAGVAPRVADHHLIDELFQMLMSVNPVLLIEGFLKSAFVS